MTQHLYVCKTAFHPQALLFGHRRTTGGVGAAEALRVAAALGKVHHKALRCRCPLHSNGQGGILLPCFCCSVRPLQSELGLLF